MHLVFPRILLSIALALLGLGHTSAAEAALFPEARVHLLDGPFKQMQERQRLDLVGRLDADRLLVPYRRVAGLPIAPGVRGYGGWDEGFLGGHLAGHALVAAARLGPATGDPRLRDLARAVVAGMAEVQDRLGTGFVAGIPESALDRVEREPRRGSVPYYTVDKVLAGLVAVATAWDDPQARAVAGRLADRLADRLDRLDEAAIEALLRTDWTGNPVNEPGAMAETLVDLADLEQRHGDPRAPRHLALGRRFVRPWLVDPLVAGEDRLDGLHGNTHIAQANGVARLARATDDPRLAQAARTFLDLLVRNHSFVTGGNSFDEKLRQPGVETTGTGPAALSPRTGESCNVHNLLRLAQQAFILAPDPALGDLMEHLLLNHVLAALAPESGLPTYMLPLRPGDFRTYIDSPYCCFGTGLETGARFGNPIWFHHDETLWLTVPIASTLDWQERGLRLRLEPVGTPVVALSGGTWRLTVDGDAPTTADLRLRIPAWVPAPVTPRINGQPVAEATPPGTFAVLKRRWQPGDQVEIDLPATLRERASRDDPRMVSWFHGPVLLAGRLGRDGMPERDIAGKDTHVHLPAWPAPFVPRGAGAPGRPQAASPTADGLPRYTLATIDPRQGTPVTVELTPFLAVHHERYAVYWPLIPADGVTEEVRRWQAADAARRSLDADLATSFIGDPVAEAAYGLAGERMATGTHAGHRWRDARDGGWFSYRLPVDTTGDAELRCTYWGGDGGDRHFDVVIDGTVVATQRLTGSAPGTFVTIRTPLPAALVANRQFVTIRFQARPGARAGGVYGCRVTPAAP